MKGGPTESFFTTAATRQKCWRPHGGDEGAEPLECCFYGQAPAAKAPRHLAGVNTLAGVDIKATGRESSCEMVAGALVVCVT